MDDRKLLKKAREDYVLGSDYAIRDLFDRFEQMLDDKEPKSIVWEPKKGERYSVVLGDGEVYTNNWQNSGEDRRRLKHHNVYKTRELAKKAAPHQRRFNMVLQAVLELEPNQVVDWKDGNQVKYQVYFDHNCGHWGDAWTGFFDQGYPVLTDKKNVQPLVDYLNAKEQKQ